MRRGGTHRADSKSPLTCPADWVAERALCELISAAGRGAARNFLGEVLRRALALHPGGVPGSSRRQGGSTDGKEERPEEETRQSGVEGNGPRAQGVREVPRRAQGADPDGAAQGRGLGQPGARPPLLADRPRHPRPAEGAWLGGQGHRPARRRPPARVPGHGGLLAAEPEIHAGFRPGLAGRANCATACCTNPLGP